MKKVDVRARREAIVDFISGHERTTSEIRSEFGEAPRHAIMGDLKNLRHAGIIMRVAPATYALRAEADRETEHPFVNYRFTNYDRWKCGIKKRERIPIVVELYQSGTPIKDIAERFGVYEPTIRGYLAEMQII